MVYRRRHHESSDGKSTGRGRKDRTMTEARLPGSHCKKIVRQGSCISGVRDRNRGYFKGCNLKAVEVAEIIFRFHGLLESVGLPCRSCFLAAL